MFKNGICISGYFHFDMIIMTRWIRKQPKYTHRVALRQRNWKLFTPSPFSCFYDYQNMKRNEFQKQKLLVHFLLKMASRIIVNIHCSIYSLNINIFCLHTLLTKSMPVKSKKYLSLALNTNHIPSIPLSQIWNNLWIKLISHHSVCLRIILFCTESTELPLGSA